MVTKYVSQGRCHWQELAVSNNAQVQPGWHPVRPLYVTMSRSVAYAQPDLVLLTTLSEFVPLPKVRAHRVWYHKKQVLGILCTHV